MKTGTFCMTYDSSISYNTGILELFGIFLFSWIFTVIILTYKVEINSRNSNQIRNKFNHPNDFSGYFLPSCFLSISSMTERQKDSKKVQCILFQYSQPFLTRNSMRLTMFKSFMIFDALFLKIRYVK